MPLCSPKKAAFDDAGADGGAVCREHLEFDHTVGEQQVFALL